MAWTTPASYSVSEVLAAAKLNTHVRDNLLYLHGDAGGVTINNALTSTSNIVANGGILRVAGSSAALYLRDNTSGADMKVWRWIASANVLGLQGLDDPETSGSAYGLQFARSGTSITSATFGSVPTNFGDMISVSGVGVNGLGGMWMDAALGTHRAFFGLTPGAASPVRLFSSALGADVLSVDLNTGNTSVIGTLACATTLAISGGANITGAVNLKLTATTGDVISHGVMRPDGDNVYTCGNGGARWSAVHAVNGTIQTSSRETKRVLGTVEPGGAMASLRGLPVYRFHYLKGDGEPDTDFVHTGPMAEEMPAALMPAPGTVNGQDTAGYLLAALQDVDARLQKLEAKQQEAA